MHPYERTGLGKAPFRCIGMDENWYVACQGAPRQPGGTCDHCMTGIAYQFRIRSADGKEFVVGSECVMKLEREDNCSPDDLAMVRKVKNLMEPIERAKRDAAKAREQARIDEFKSNLKDDAFRARLAAYPSPTRPDRESALEWAEWMMVHAGHAGSLKVVRQAEKLFKEPPPDADAVQEARRAAAKAEAERRAQELRERQEHARQVEQIKREANRPIVAEIDAYLGVGNGQEWKMGFLRSVREGLAEGRSPSTLGRGRDMLIGILARGSKCLQTKRYTQIEAMVEAAEAAHLGARYGASVEVHQ
jgi:hypothetical protein